MKILVETSARHIHLSKEALEILFGKNYELSVRKELSQPGQFACNERVTIVGPKSSINNVSILGPVRAKTQVEISLTDARKLGINTEIRESGDISKTAGCEIIGPSGSLKITEGVIIAKRHIHMNFKDAENLGVKNGQIVEVSIESETRPTVFGGTVVRVSNDYALAMHIDTDEANAAGISGLTYGAIV